MNEHDNLTPAEMESYRSALKEAYPAPKTDIHANVMKQIRAERLAQKMRKRRAAFVKWGSVAACLLLVCVIALRVIPELDKLAPVAENSMGAMAEDVSVARYDVRDNDAHTPHEKVSEEDYSFPSDDGQNSGTAQPYDPQYGYTVEFPADEDERAEMMDQMSGGKTPASDDFTTENEPSSIPNAEGVMTEAPQVDAHETEEETEEVEETAVTEETR